MSQERSPKFRNKPYIVYNEYGTGMIAHPAIPVLVGIPNPDKIKREEGEDLKWLEEEVFSLIFKYWDKITLPSIKTIRS
jgi:hypothetical protein